MNETTLLTAFFALITAVAWGSGDFSGGLASKKHNAYSVLIVAQLISAVPLLLSVLIFERQVPLVGDLLLGGLGGVLGMIGLLNLYVGLSKGRMGIVAPLVAIITGIIPVLVGILTDGAPSTLQLIGFAVALVAVWLLSSDGRHLAATPIELRYSIISGLGFAAFYIAIDRVSGETAIWPVLAARVASLGALSLYTFNRGEWKAPARSLLPLLALAGILDTAGNYFFTLATQTGRLDITTIVASLYPAFTVMLAWIVLKERLKRQQWIGVIIALIAIALIAL